MHKSISYPSFGRRSWRTAFASLAIGALVAVGCSDLTVPNYNNPDIDQIQGTPSRAAVTSAATGILIGARANIAGPNQYVSLLGIVGRESYNFDGSEPRFISEMLAGPMSPSGAFGGNLWAIRYQNIRNANLVLNALNKLPNDPVSGMTDVEKEATRGFAKTMQALDFLMVINTRDTNGAPIDVDRPLSADPAPIVGRRQVLEHIVKLLNDADQHLQAGGDRFPFPVSSGFAGFSTPQTFRQFNRALKARVDVYMGAHAAALTSLQGSFLDAGGDLTRGVYHTYATGSGETPNTLNAATIRAHPSIVTDAEQRPNGEVDRRVQSKTTTMSPITQQGVTSNVGFTIYAGPSAPVPIVRNEELILLRAEARWFTGDRAGALADLNVIRETSGGLAPVGRPADDAAFVTELLKQRRYSLLFEGGHRWIDMRRFGRSESLPRDVASHLIHVRFPIPEAECLARGIQGECAAS
jgi:starch-binding outer membrane protein, SusD/RagB family